MTLCYDIGIHPLRFILNLKMSNLKNILFFSFSFSFLLFFSQPLTLPPQGGFCVSAALTGTVPEKCLFSYPCADGEEDEEEEGVCVCVGGFSSEPRDTD